MSLEHIEQNIKEILEEIPANVEVVAAAKTRTPQEIREAVAAGVQIIGENYVQEAEEAFAVIGHDVRWHFIGHLQKNKVRKAVQIFDLIETVDSIELAKEIDKRCKAIDKIMPVLVEINSGKEQQKQGVFPEHARGLMENITELSHVKVKGLMTMGPYCGDPEDARPYFAAARKVFEEIKNTGIPGAQMQYLSMGMTNSYRIAIEEGANIVRIGTKIFGDRP